MHITCRLSITISSLRVPRLNTWTSTLSPSSIVQPSVHNGVLRQLATKEASQCTRQNPTCIGETQQDSDDDDGRLQTLHADVAPSVEVDVFPRPWGRILLSGMIIHRARYPRGLRLVRLLMSAPPSMLVVVHYGVQRDVDGGDVRLLLRPPRSGNA